MLEPPRPMPFLVVLGFFVASVVFLWRIGAREKGLPPGPRTLPIVGNLHIFPKKHPHLKFTEWARKYGGIYSLKIGPGTAIVVTDANVVRELLEKRSATTADRPLMYVAELVTGGLNMAFAQYGDTWRVMRKAAHSILAPQATARHLHIQSAEAIQLLHDILCTHQDFYTHVGRYSNSVIMSVLYGKRAPRYETPETIAFYHMMHEWMNLLEPGVTPPVDFLPVLKFIPERWAKWIRTTRRVRALQRELFFGLLEAVEERMRKGEQNGSYVEELLEKQNQFGMDREMTAYFAGALVEGGSDTTASFLKSFILCLAAYPDAQIKAQQELDSLVGQNRMPTLDDLEHLPYIRAMILETHRLLPVTPLLIPHRTSASQKFESYVIPRGCTIFINAWGIFHDPMLYDDPENFLPERYLLTENGTKPGLDTSSLKPNLAFGVGRRFCPGIHLAQNSININVLNLVWAFDFEPEVGADGNVTKLDTSSYSKGVVTSPLPFKCKITPRSEEKAGIIRREFADAADTYKKFEFGLSSEDKEFVAKSREC